MLPEISKRLKKKGVTREMLHAEYMEKHPDGYGRSRFNNAVHTYLQLSKPVMHIDHKRVIRCILTSQEASYN
jgi:transposase